MGILWVLRQTEARVVILASSGGGGENRRKQEGIQAGNYIFYYEARWKEIYMGECYVSVDDRAMKNRYRDARDMEGSARYTSVASPLPSLRDGTHAR